MVRERSDPVPFEPEALCPSEQAPWRLDGKAGIEAPATAGLDRSTLPRGPEPRHRLPLPFGSEGVRLGGPEKTRVQLGPFVGSTELRPSHQGIRASALPATSAGRERRGTAAPGAPNGEGDRERPRAERLAARGMPPSVTGTRRHAGHGAATPRLKAVPTEEIPRSALYGWNRSCDSAESKVAREDQGNAGSVRHAAGGEY